MDRSLRASASASEHDNNGTGMKAGAGSGAISEQTDTANIGANMKAGADSGAINNQTDTANIGAGMKAGADSGANNNSVDAKASANSNNGANTNTSAGTSTNINTNASANKSTSSWNTKQLVIVALFTALCTLLSFVEIPIFPAAPWLKYDPSACIAMLAAFAFGPVSGLIVGSCSAIIHGLILGDPWGALITLVYLIFWTLPAALIFKAKQTRPWVVFGLVACAALALAATIAANLVITPIYAGMSVDAVAALIVPVLIPFNLLKTLINSVLLFALYNPVLKLSQR